MPMFGPIRPQQPQPSQTDTDRAAQFQALVEIIRTEIRVGVDPLRGDIATLKAAIEDVRRAQQLVYTREVMDLKLRERDDAIRITREENKELSQDIADLRKTIGAFWMTSLTRVGAVAGTFAAVLGLWQLLQP